MIETLHDKKVRAGSLGGKAVMNKYGREFFRHLGGGRPREPGIEEIRRQQSALDALKKEKEAELSTSDRLRELKELYRLRIKGMGGAAASAPPKEAKGELFDNGQSEGRFPEVKRDEA